tara:strand:+ start:1554 stop:1766 length:213 start_codon:yes stop_codon:yes gene_type:complete
MTDFLKVKDHNGLVRDSHSKAILNVDKTEYLAYISKQQKAKRLENVENKVFDLQKDLSEIKQLLQQLVSK